MAIQILPENVANQIAAGEVVERPASVVKELLENAIDAGADRILIEIEKSGKKRIQITDNGVGMNPEDARLAFERHATSKVREAEDLETVQSLGFRGEALPSISSVARVKLSTYAEGGEAGTEVVIEGGSAPAFREIAHTRGTCIEVCDLFYNTPARQKFMKGDGTETSHITQVVTQQALARPEIHFTLRHNGRKILDTLPTELAQYRIAELFGAEMARELIQVEAEEGGYKLHGYISSPILTRGSRNAQYSFINGRYIRDKVVLHATQQGYSHLLPRGQHPVLFIFLSMDPKLIDVNVHPAKAEVRFAYQQEVHRFISKAIQNALKDNEKAFEAAPGRPSTGSPQREQPAGPSTSFFETRSNPFTPSEKSADPGKHRERFDPAYSRAAEQLYRAPTPGFHGGAGQPEGGVEFFNAKPVAVSDLIFSEFEPIGQLDHSFIIMQGKTGILVVDQHIAHERVLYERYKKEAINKNIEIQTLLFPLAIDFTPAEAELLTGHLERLKELGVELEPFGSHGFLLRAIPALLKNKNHEEMLHDIVEALPRDSSEQVIQQRFEEIMIMMSCRNAITINHPMGLDQIRKLMYDLEQTEMPYTCPHGRPIALFFDVDDILKKFHRK